MAVIPDRHLAGLLTVRNGIAAFEGTGSREARSAGLTHVQHHVLLALRGHPEPDGARVADIAHALSIASPSAVELVARMVAAELLTRRPDPRDRRATRLQLTRLGERLMHQLGEAHLPRLRELTSRGVVLLAD